MIRKILTFLMIVVSYVTYADETPKKVYLLPIDMEIGSTSWQHTKNALEEAERMKADLVVLKLNTYGGTVDHADSIRTSLLHTKIPTVAFIDNNAASAGALIALACDSVFMRPDATMGAATVVNGNDGTQMPDKYQSYMRGMMRATAERHGKTEQGKWRRNPLIAEAMVDSRTVVPGLIDSTRVLTFTPDEAIEWGYADGKAENIGEVLSQLDIHNYSLTQYKHTWIDSLLGFFTNPVVESILIMIMIGGIYFELQTPGMGFPTVAAISAAVLYFLPLYLTGIASSWIVILFIIGVILLLLEIFVIPGFGVSGIAGIVLIVASIFMGLMENFSMPYYNFNSTVIWKSLLTLAVGAFLAVGLIVYLSSKYAPAFVTRRGTLTHAQKIEDGYIGVDQSLSKLVGIHCVAATDLRPSGKIEISGERYDAVSIDGFIEAGTPLKITKYVNAQLYVKLDDK